MQQGADRRRRDHGGRQPAMERHQSGLAGAVDEHDQQQPAEDRRDLSGEDSAGPKIECPGRQGCQHDRRQQQADRSGQQNAEVDAPAPHRVPVAVMGHQRIGQDRQHFVENEQREEVGGEGNANRRPKGEGETDVETGLVRFPVAPHIADRVDRIDDPQKTRDRGEHHAERFDLEGDRDARNDLDHG